VRNEELLRRIKEVRNIVQTVNRRKANWIGHILRRNCLLKQSIEGKIEGSIEVTVRRGRRCRQLLDDLEENERVLEIGTRSTRGHSVATIRFGRGCGPVVRQAAE
jgi:hypothetical protein